MKKSGRKVFNGLTMLFFLIALIIPTIIIIVTKIYTKDFVTCTFLVITGVLYVIAILLMTPILNIMNDIKGILKEGNEIKSLNGLNNLINNSNSIYIKKSFNNFIDSLRSVEIEKESGEIEKQYFSTIEVDYFLDEQNIISKNISSKTINQIINSLTGVGIFGTFLGIVQGVSGLEFTNSEALKSGIETLVKGVKVSFNSSLYGILFSVICLIIYKLVIDLTMKEVNLLCNKVSEIVKPYKEESGFSVLEEELKKQTGINEKLASDIAEEMGRKFNESIESNLEKLSDNMGTLLERIQDEFANKINESSSKSIVTLTNTLVPTMEKLETCLNGMQKYQQESTSKFLEESILSIKDTISIGTTNEVNRLKDSMEIITSENAKLVDKFTTAMENMSSLTSQQELLIRNSTNSAEAVNNTTLNMKEVQADLFNIINSLKDYSASNSVSLENIQGTVESLKEAIMQQAEVNSKLESMISKSSELNKLQDSYLLKFRSVENSVENNLNDIQVNMERINKDIKSYQEYFDYIQTSSANIVEMLNNKYEKISSDFENMNNSLINTISTINSKLLGEVNEMGTSLSGVTKELSSFQTKTYNLTSKIEKFAEVEESTQILWENYKDSFIDLNKNVNEGIENYTRLVSNSVESLFKQYDSKIGEAITKIGIMVQSLAETAEDICDNLESVEKLKNEIKDLNNRR